MADEVRWGRRAAVALAGVVLTVGMLAGCSAGASTGGGGADSGVVEEGPVSGGAVVGDVPADDRSVVVEGTMSVRVEDVAAAGDAAVRIAAQAGGRVDGRNEWTESEGGAAQVELVLRIPADELEGALDELRALGELGSLQTSTTDVTTAVQDTDARIAALRSTVERLQGFQQQAGSIKDLLAIEDEISTRQAELEELLARQADLAEQTSFSTLTLTLFSEATPVDTVPDSFGAGVVTGWNAFAGFVGGALVVLGVLLPWIVTAAIVTAAVLVVVRWRKRRRPVPPPANPGGGGATDAGVPHPGLPPAYRGAPVGAGASGTEPGDPPPGPR